MERAEFGNDCQSPRISFSLYLSHTDRTSTEEQKSEDVADINYNTDFEFCIVCNVNDHRDEDFRKNLIAADELFVDGKILPQIRPLDPRPITIARHLSLESSRCPSTVRSASSNRPSGWWNETFQLSNREYLCENLEEAEEDTKESSNHEQQKRSLWPFSRSRRETRGNGFFSSFPFFRSKSAGEEKSKPVDAALCFRRSMTVGARPGFKETEAVLAKADVLKKVTDFLPNSKGSDLRTPRAELGSRGRVGRASGRFTVRNLERCGGMAMDSPRSMAEKVVKSNSNTGMSVRVSPVLNLCMFSTSFSKPERKRTHQYHHSDGSINRKKDSRLIHL